MNDKKINIVISSITLIAAVLMLVTLSYAIGKWSFASGGITVSVQFPTASGLSINSEVKYAGAPIGRVKSIKLIPRSEQTPDVQTGQYNVVAVLAELNPGVEIGEDAQATIKQDGLGISPKYLMITPGMNHNSKLLSDGATLQGQTPFELTDLAQPAGEALSKVNHMISQIEPLFTSLQPTIDQFNQLSQRLPGILDKTEKVLDHGEGVLANLDTEQSKENLAKVLTNLHVVTDNLKVVTTNAKALTATLADKPWRLVWGGKTVEPPPETEIMKSDEALPLKKVVEINAPADKPKSVSNSPIPAN